MRRTIAVAVLLLVTAAFAMAQEPLTTDAAEVVTNAHKVEAGPVPVPEPSEKALRYY